MDDIISHLKFLSDKFVLLFDSCLLVFISFLLVPTVIARNDEAFIEKVVDQSCRLKARKYGNIFIKKYVDELDLWIVSHGAVGSNNLISFLEKKTRLKMVNDFSKYQISCHYPRFFQTRARVLYIAGEIPHAIASMERRSFLIPNTIKIIFGGSGRCRPVERYWKKWIQARLLKNKTDPLGIQGQALSFLSANSDIVGFLRYPYCQKDLVQIFSKLKLIDQSRAQAIFDDFQCKSLSTSHTPISNVTAALMESYFSFNNILSVLPTASLSTDPDLRRIITLNFPV